MHARRGARGDSPRPDGGGPAARGLAVSGSTRKGTTARPRTKKPVNRGWALSPLAYRWVFIGGFTLAILVGLPLLHALVGEVGAILVGTFIFGFVVGRMTKGG